MPFKKVEFRNQDGYKLKARLELPLTQHPKAYAVFAHVFTGNKNLTATRHISRALTLGGFGVLRFDFTGLGESEGDFADTNFTSNVEDIIAACDYLTEHYEAPSIIVGHSLGGAASVFAASRVDSIRAVATIGAPSEPAHVKHLIHSSIEEIERTGKAWVDIGGQKFCIKKQFLDDLQNKNMFEVLRNMKKAILVMHSPQDTVVKIENASQIYHAAFHPKSFVTLDNANHMLTNKDDAFYVGNLISSWAQRYINVDIDDKLHTDKQIVARLEGEGFTTDIMAGNHGLIADESESLGGNDFGPSPYDLVSAGLGACTAMTMKMYARRKKWPLEEVNVHVSYSRNYQEDCQACIESEPRLDFFEREIEIEGDLDDKQRARLLEIANRCPVHLSMERVAVIETRERR